MPDNTNLPEKNDWADRNEKPTQWGARIDDASRAEARRTRRGPQIFNIIGAHIIGAFLTFLVMNVLGLVINETVATVVGYAVGIFSFTAVTYIEGWHAGERDINMMNYGHIPRDKFRGLKCAMIAESVGLLFAVLMVAHGFVVLSQRAQGLDPLMQTGISAVIPIVYHTFYMPFLFVLQKLEDVSPLFCLLPVLIAPAIYHVAYTFGMKHFSILARLVYKKPDKEKK